MARRKVSRKEQRRQQLAQEQRRRRLMIGIPATIVLVGLAVLIFIRFVRPIEGVEEFGSQERGHDAQINIDSLGRPPVGGVHDPQWQNCGIYDEPVENAHAVHSLEHGAVWLTYDPDLRADQVAMLEEYAENQTFILVSPYPGQESNVMATAWGVQIAVDSLPDERIDQFIARYRGQGPEPGASCSNGTGTPHG